MTPYYTRKLIALAVTALVLALLRFLIGRAGAKALTATSGTIAPNRWFVGISTLACFAIAAFAFIQTGTRLTPNAALAIEIGATAMGLACATSLLPLYNISWNETGISGPTSLWFPPIGPNRITLPWDQVHKVVVRGSKRYIADANGRKIHWNWIYTGHAQFERTLQAPRQRPAAPDAPLRNGGLV